MMEKQAEHTVLEKPAFPSTAGDILEGSPLGKYQWPYTKELTAFSHLISIYSL